MGVKTTQNSVNVGPKLAAKITKPEVQQGGGVKDMFKRGDRKLCQIHSKLAKCTAVLGGGGKTHNGSQTLTHPV